MPISIDLDHITGPFRSIGRFQLTPIAYIFQRLGKWLNDRVEKADKLEESSRGIPVVWMDDDGVQCWLDAIQLGALSPNGSPPGFWDQMRAAAGAFWAGLQHIPQAIENEDIVPRFLSRVQAGLKAILDSVIRFEHPTASTFDPRLRTAGDLFGEAALAFNALNSSRSQVLMFLFGDVGLSYLVLTSGGEKTSSPTDPKSTIDMLDSISRYVLSALMLLPYLPDLISRLWESASLSIKKNTIEALAAREMKVQDLRRTIIDVFYVKLRDLIQTALSFIYVAATVLTMQVSFWSDFVHNYGARLLMDVGKIADDLADFMFKVAGWIKDKFITSFDKYLKYDLAPLIMTLVGGVAGLIASKIKKPPPFTLLDLIHSEARSLLLSWIGDTMALLQVAGGVVTIPIQLRLAALAKVVSGVLGPVGPPLEETAWPSMPPPFPSIYDQWAKAAGESAIQKKFEDLKTHAPAALTQLVSAAGNAVSQAGNQFDDLAAGAARGGSVQQYLALSERATTLARNAFGPEADALREQIAKDQKDVVASSFESWFALGGFEVLGQFLERYVIGMLDKFSEQEATGDELTVHIDKTSPHILAKRAVLGRALMQTLTIDARGRSLDASLVQEIADKFRGAVVDAYKAGQNQLLEAATAVAL